MINEVLDFQKNKGLPSTNIDSHFLGIPSTPGTNAVMSFFGNASDLETYKKRFKKINHNTNIEILENRSARKIITKNEDTELVIEIDDIDTFTKNNKSVKKIFLYILYKLSQQQIIQNLFEDLSIEFNLQELVSLGLYQNMDTARVGFKNAKTILTSLKVEGLIKDKNTKKAIGEGTSVLFTNAFIIKGTCIFTLNKFINWPVFALLYFAPIPTTYFALPSTPSDLMYLVFTQARMRKKELKDKGFFTLKLRTVQQALGLISEEKTKSPTDKIKKPILEAIEVVNSAENNPDFHISIDYDKNGTIKDFLDKGFITISMKGNYSKHLIQIAENQEAKIQALKDRKESIAKQAEIKALADKKNK